MAKVSGELPVRFLVLWLQRCCLMHCLGILGALPVLDTWCPSKTTARCKPNGDMSICSPQAKMYHNVPSSTASKSKNAGDRHCGILSGATTWGADTSYWSSSLNPGSSASQPASCQYTPEVAVTQVCGSLPPKWSSSCPASA